MSLALTRILLITLALALNGQAFAAPCAGGNSGGEHGGEHHQAGQAAQHCAPESHHCDATSQASTIQDSGPESCEQACSCCPGHCASAITAQSVHGPAALAPVAHTLYAELQSSPLPEAALRPPITT
ncbi:hypothetical protein [Microbulbifer sp. YPW16]|uniref:hypothetical protein n=1 Tax=Microbulbifer sp. YPW16 TaxID=2904242 RepID=UPI001E5D7BC7|nr:hypothetical protein [Microbulbifer sp. YPW16]UHQ56781.1 hypothetical protein LVE68_07360 [Microbulbifer sp. YPW16]